MMLKRLSTGLLVMSFLSLISPVFAAFNDVPDSHPHKAAIDFVQNEGIVKGYQDGTFKPEQRINRAEFTKILIESLFTQEDLQLCLGKKPNLYTDVTVTDWFAGPVCIATDYLIINGYTDGSFKPEAFINHAEASKIIVTTYDLPEANISSEQQWYEAYTQVLDSMQITPESIQKPTQAITRGEMAEMIYRILSETPEKTAYNPESSLDFASERQAVISLVNDERSAAGLAPLDYNRFLEISAQKHADDMRDRNYFEHDTPEGMTAEDRIDRDGYLKTYHDCLCSKSYSVGENIAKGQITPEEVVNTWMNSPQHRANILSPDFKEIGIGITPVDPNDTGFTGYFWVQNFGAINLQ